MLEDLNPKVATYVPYFLVYTISRAQRVHHSLIQQTLDNVVAGYIRVVEWEICTDESSQPSHEQLQTCLSSDMSLVLTTRSDPSRLLRLRPDLPKTLD